VVPVQLGDKLSVELGPAQTTTRCSPPPRKVRNRLPPVPPNRLLVSDQGTPNARIPRFCHDDLARPLGSYKSKADH